MGCENEKLAAIQAAAKMKADLIMEILLKRRTCAPNDAFLRSYQRSLCATIVCHPAYRQADHTVSRRTGLSRFDGVTRQLHALICRRTAVGYATQVGCMQPTCAANPPYASGGIN